MSIKADDETMTNGCTFRWKIENINICWSRRGEGIVSPTFIADSLERTKWSLQLYTRGETIYNSIGFYLHREKNSRGPKIITVKYQLAILGKDGSFLTERTVSECGFEKDERCGFEYYIEKHKVFVTEREVFVPKNTLTVQCTIWYKDGIPIRQQRLNARTIYKENRRSFVWKFEKFSILKFSPKKHFKHDLIEFDIFLNEESDDDKLFTISINSLDERLKCFSFKISVVDNEGKKENSRPFLYLADDLKRGIIRTGILDNKLMENRSLYFPNDVLTLDCEYVMPTETAFLEFFPSGKISPELRNGVVDDRNENYMDKEKLLKDLKCMLNDAIFSDTEIRTSSRSFPAHKGILSSRSPVFKSMFSHDMKERSCGYIDIIDFDDDTIHRMLLFLYTDSLENLQFESASKLYRIADKYQILPLKGKCSSFFKENFCPTNVFDILVLADLHHDDDLKSIAQDYILGHTKEIFCLQEWKYFMDSHLKLAADVMYRKLYEE